MPEKEMRAAYCEALLEVSQTNDAVVVLDADLMGAAGLTPYKSAFPDRYFNVGVAEANMVGIASGLATMGKIPFISSFACFAARRAYDQFFISANYARLKVNLTGSDPGVSALLNGGTHMSFEDVGIMRCTPRLIIYEPADSVSLKALVKQAATVPNCTYLRMHRKSVDRLYDETEVFNFGKGKALRDGKDATIVATGAVMIAEAVKAADQLAREGVDVAILDMFCIKPFDEELVLRYAKKTGAVVVCENHRVGTGIGSAIAVSLLEKFPVPFHIVGIGEDFGEVGDFKFLLRKFNLGAESIAAAVKSLLRRRRT